jgi:hypothetical protein
MTYLSTVVSYSQLKIIGAAIENTTATHKTVSQRAMEAAIVPRKTISMKTRRKQRNRVAPLIETEKKKSSGLARPCSVDLLP